MKTIPPIDVEQITKLIEEFIRIRVKESGLNGVVIGVSGGIDSAVVTTLAVRALGPERVFALFLPSGTTPSEDLADVTNLCKILGINLKVIDIQNIIHSVSTEIKEKEDFIFTKSKSKIMNFEWMEALEIYNLVDLAVVMTEAALFRKESRESHYREDYPEHFPGGDNQNWGVETVATFKDGKTKIDKVPVEYGEIKPGEFEVKEVDVPYQTFRA